MPPIDDSVIKVKQHSLQPLRPDRVAYPDRDQERVLEMTQMHEQQLADTCAKVRWLLTSTLARHGKGPIDAPTAVRLSKRIGMPAEFWLGMPMDNHFDAATVATAGPKRRLTRHGLRD